MENQNKKSRGRPKRPQPTKDEKIQLLEEQIGNFKVQLQTLEDEYHKFKSVGHNYPIISELVGEELEDLKEELEELNETLDEVRKE